MNARPVDREDPDRLYTITAGRSHAAGNAFDLVTLILSKSDPAPGMQSEYVKILQMCRRPVAVVEISADLRLPVTVVKILLRDLLDAGSITVRQPAADFETQQPDITTLKQVLVGLKKL